MLQKGRTKMYITVDILCKKFVDSVDGREGVPAGLGPPVCKKEDSVADCGW